MEKVAKLVVNEINNIEKLHSMLELGMRLNKDMPAEARKTVGLGCGNHCDAWGLICGKNCLRGLELTEGLIKDRYAVDVLGSKCLEPKDMIEIQENFEKLHDAMITVIAEELSLKNMEERIQKFGKKE